MNRRRKLFNQTILKRNQIFTMYKEMILGILYSTIKWENLPDTCDSRYLERALNLRGSGVFFEDEIIGYLTLDVIYDGNFDVYGTPFKRRAYSTYNNYNKYLTNKDSVIIFNNKTRTPSINMVNTFAKIFTNLDMTIRINSNAQKTPVAFVGNEKQRLTMENVYLDYDSDIPYLFFDSSFDFNDIKTLNTNAPYVSDKIYDLKVKYWNELLTYVGVPNVSSLKKERMITDEVNRMQGGTIASRFSRIEEREIGADKINKMFGLNIKPTFLEFSTDEVNKMEKEVFNE